MTESYRLPCHVEQRAVHSDSFTGLSVSDRDRRLFVDDSRTDPIVIKAPLGAHHALYGGRDGPQQGFGARCRCARCRRNWSLRAREFRDDLNRSSQAARLLLRPHPRPLPSSIHRHRHRHRQFVHRRDSHHYSSTMVGKVSERVLAREGKSTSFCDAASADPHRQQARDAWP